MTLPLGLRNRFAELVLDAFDDAEAGRTLQALDAFCRSSDGGVGGNVAARLTDLGWFEAEAGGHVRLRGAHRAHRENLCRRVVAAARVFNEASPPPDGRTRVGLLERAARLADAGLFFEVHELLEPAWLRAEGAERVALQGLIQLAVAFHHLENGNRQGGISLLGEGIAKLGASASALPMSAQPWLAELGAVLAALREGRPLPARPSWPHPTPAGRMEGAWRFS